MNVQHKCLFHQNNAIIKFCQNSTIVSIVEQCTLPLCVECQPIHINEHNSQHSQAKILRFNEATLKASNGMQDYLDNYKRYVKEQRNKIENDREIVVNMIDQYYNAAYTMMDKIKENAEKIQEHFNKLKKGSIKTLIFYYSGDIKIDKFDMEFQPLQHKVQRLLQNKEQRTQVVPQKNIEKGYIVSSIQQEDKKYASNLSQASNVQQRVKIQKNVQNEHQNIFSNIQQIKEGRSRQRARKSIFEQNSKKGSAVTPNDTNEMQNKYNYKHNENEVREDYNSGVQPSPKFHYQPPQEYKYKYEKNISFEPEAPLSFENRFLNKFTGGQRQRDNTDKYQELIRKEVPRYQFKRYEDQFYTKMLKHSDQPYAVNNTVNNKILKPSDLQIQKQNTGKQTHTNYMLSQRNRSLSQNHISEKEAKKPNYDLDLKKQVLSPDQIRKMLQKKIQERNRILSIKKADNFQPPAEEKGKRWETRDSIINQIYTDTRQ